MYTYIYNGFINIYRTWSILKGFPGTKPTAITSESAPLRVAAMAATLSFSRSSAARLTDEVSTALTCVHSQGHRNGLTRTRALCQSKVLTAGLHTKSRRAHTQKELIRWGGAKRASEGREALCPPVFHARRRQKRQHMYSN